MNVVITAGGTSEKIDNVRKITNSSSGKLGRIIANTFLKSDLELDTIFYVCSKQSLKPNHKKVKIILIESAADLLDAVSTILTTYQIDVFIHAMAVSDYTVDYVTTASLLYNGRKHFLQDESSFKEFINNNHYILNREEKISSQEEDLMIKLKPTQKVISRIKTLSPKTVLVGFKLLNSVTKEELIDAGYNLLEKNNCNLVIANDLKQINEKEHKAFFIDKNKKIIEVNTKIEIAKRLVKVLKDNKLTP